MGKFMFAVGTLLTTRSTTKGTLQELLAPIQHFGFAPLRKSCLPTSSRQFNRPLIAKTRKQIILRKTCKKITSCQNQNRLAPKNEHSVTEDISESQRNQFWAQFCSIFFLIASVMSLFIKSAADTKLVGFGEHLRRED